MKDTPPFSPKLPNEFIEKLTKEQSGLVINITYMRLRAYVGINEWEQANRQDVIINISITCSTNAYVSCSSDAIQDTLNYKDISKKVISCVEDSRFLLVEKMAAAILAIAIEPALACSATVKVEKPGALRFSDSVGVSISGSKNE